MSRTVRRTVAVVLAVAALVLGLAAAPAADAASLGHSRAVVKGNFADPGFAHFGSYYYLYATGTGFPVRRASSAQGTYKKVTSSGKAMAHIPGWVGKGSDGGYHLWAPSVFRVKKSNGVYLYVMYFTGYRKGWGSNCVGVATSSYPSHGFTAYGNPICAVHSDHEAIDPSPYRDAQGRRWIVFKTNVGNVRDFRIQAIQMDGTYGVNPLGGTRRTLISSPSSRMEAPSLISHGGKVWLFLARGDYANCTYSTDAHYASSITGTFHLSRTVLSQKSTGLCGPGGATVIQDGSTTRIAFHAWHGGTLGKGVRWAYVGSLTWKSGKPYLY